MHRSRPCSVALLPIALALALPAAAGAKASKAAGKKSPDEKMADQLEKDLERFWGKKRAVQVVVNRLYPKAQRFELDFFVGVLPNDHFLIYLSPGLRMAWHFSEQLALEIGGAYSHGFDTGLRDQLQEDDALIDAKLRDRVLARFGIGLVWTPFYGKFAAVNRKIAHFDLYFVLELSSMYTTKNRELGLKGGVRGFAGGLGVGLRFYVSRLFNFRVEFRQRFAAREGRDDQLFRFATPSEISLGFSFLLGKGAKAPEEK